MILKVCQNCTYDTEKSGISYCKKEGCYSYLSKCIHRKAIEMFISANSVIELSSKNLLHQTDFR